MISQLLAKSQQAYERMWRGPLTSTQFRLMEYLEKHNEVVQSSVISRVSIDRSTLSEMCKRLHDQGFIRRVKDDDDKRKVLISLTDKGRLGLKQTRRHLETADDEFLAVFKHKDRALFVELLTEVSNAHS